MLDNQDMVSAENVITELAVAQLLLNPKFLCKNPYNYGLSGVGVDQFYHGLIIYKDTKVSVSTSLDLHIEGFGFLGSSPQVTFWTQIFLNLSSP